MPCDSLVGNAAIWLDISAILFAYAGELMACGGPFGGAGIPAGGGFETVFGAAVVGGALATPRGEAVPVPRAGAFFW